MHSLIHLLINFYSFQMDDGCYTVVLVSCNSTVVRMSDLQLAGHRFNYQPFYFM